MPEDDPTRGHTTPEPVTPDPAPADADATARDATAGPAVARRTPVTQQLGRVASLAIAVLFGIFAVSNAQYVDFNWVFGGTEVVEQAGQRVSGGTRLIVLMVGSFLAGLVVATLDAWRRSRRKRRTAA